jgi:holo-[acyl-carrier protein] synthase
MTAELAASAAGRDDLGVGVDCEEVARFRALLPRLDDVQRALFSEEEHAYCRAQPDPAPHYAGRWCAKEAVVKALAPLRLTTRAVRILAAADGRPVAVVDLPSGEEAPAVRLSISHTATTAVAFAVAIFPAPPPPTGS